MLSLSVCCDFSCEKQYFFFFCIYTKDQLLIDLDTAYLKTLLLLLAQSQILSCSVSSKISISCTICIHCFQHYLSCFRVRLASQKACNHMPEVIVDIIAYLTDVCVSPVPVTLIRFVGFSTKTVVTVCVQNC